MEYIQQSNTPCNSTNNYEGLQGIGGVSTNGVVRERGSRGGSDSAFPFTIAASRSTQQIQLENNKLSFWVRESRLIFVGVISLIVIAISAAIILIINDCSVNSASFSLISAIVGGWLSLLTRQKMK